MAHFTGNLPLDAQGKYFKSTTQISFLTLLQWDSRKSFHVPFPFFFPPHFTTKVENFRSKKTREFKRYLLHCVWKPDFPTKHQNARKQET